VKVVVDQHRCASSGNCALAVSAVFDQRPDDGVVVLLNESPPDSMADEILEAQDMCPAQAIFVET
jgi:ferredoxin